MLNRTFLTCTVDGFPGALNCCLGAPCVNPSLHSSNTRPVHAQWHCQACGNATGFSDPPQQSEKVAYSEALSRQTARLFFFWHNNNAIQVNDQRCCQACV